MRALLDINVLIALLDESHQHHAPARNWMLENVGQGWASCPITQNGCVRILSQPAYPNTVPTAIALDKLGRACSTAHHEFWPDRVSLLDDTVVHSDRIHGPRQLTDLYLVALAVARGGRFVTFDGAIAIGAVRRSNKRHLVVI